MLCYAMLGYAMLCYAICSALIRDKQSDQIMALTHLETSPEIAGLDKHGCNKLFFVRCIAKGQREPEGTKDEIAARGPRSGLDPVPSGEVLVSIFRVFLSKGNPKASLLGNNTFCRQTV